MPILLIAPSLSPGTSGVGDYAARLADGLQQKGAACRLLSLCESESPDTSYQDRLDERILRLRANSSWPARMKDLSSLRSDFEPQVVSLQFVTYGYHPKGLPFGLATRLRNVLTDVRFEVMFHEIWCGGRGARLRDQVYGFLQRRIIRDLVRQLNPVVIHTHATPYLEALRQEGWNPRQLPLFSNIPVTESWCAQSFDQWFEARSGFQGATSRVIFCLFGSLYPQWQPDSLLPVVRQYLTQRGRKGLILSIGHRGSAGNGAWEKVVRQSDEQLHCLDLGPLAEQEISQCLHASDYGISTTPPDLIQKSAAAAAMFEHGLPVLASRPPVYGEAMAKMVGKTVPLLIQGRNLTGLSSYRKLPADRQGLARVADQFLSDFRLNCGI